MAGLRKGAGGDGCGLVFARDPMRAGLAEFLDEDGLPYPSTKLTEGDPLYCYFNQGGILDRYSKKRGFYQS